jgi:hypothetical protein
MSRPTRGKAKLAAIKTPPGGEIAYDVPVTEPTAIRAGYAVMENKVVIQVQLLDGSRFALRLTRIAATGLARQLDNIDAQHPQLVRATTIPKGHQA